MPNLFRYYVLVNTVDPATVTKTYNGLDGCACGCGGDYAGPNTTKTVRRIATLNRKTNLTALVWPADGGRWEVCYETVTARDEDGEPTRVTRAYALVDDPASIGGVEVTRAEWMWRAA